MIMRVVVQADRRILVWYGMLWYFMVWYGMVWYGMVWYGMVWYGMVWYGNTWGVQSTEYLNETASCTAHLAV